MVYHLLAFSDCPANSSSKGSSWDCPRHESCLDLIGVHVTMARRDTNDITGVLIHEKQFKREEKHIKAAIKSCGKVWLAKNYRMSDNVK